MPGTERSLRDLIGRLDDLLPARVDASLQPGEGAPSQPKVNATRWFEGRSFSRARLDWPTPHGDVTVVLEDATRLELPRRDFLSGHDFGPDDSGAVQLEVRLDGVTITLGVYPG